MSYAQTAYAPEARPREQGSVARNAANRLSQAAQINGRLEGVLRRVRRDSPQPAGTGGVDVTPPLSDLLESMEAVQDRTMNLITELENYV